MQAYLNGFHSGDPAILPADPASTHAPHGDDRVDVLIVGTGPAGCVLGAQLAAFPGIRTRILERRGGPLELGQADGVACRSVEMFEAFDIADRVLKEAAQITETVFWRPDPTDGSRIVRSGRIEDVEEGLSEFPHVILNQARVQDFLLEKMRTAPRRLEPEYGVEVLAVEVTDAADYPVLVRTRDVNTGAESTLRARYVVGCDGARSTVRQSIGRVLRGDSANQAWGVMDALAVTDYPDIRFKSVIQSRDSGNMIIIPREGGYLVRFYIEMDELEPGERVAGRAITSDDLIAAARRILHPHTLDAREIVWWSVYEIGQRLTDKFDDVPEDEVATRLPRVFVAGDACHTHSPKAGQGMNVSMQDAFNLGWKLAAVLEGRSDPELLHTYSAERQAVAQDLIDFDKEWAAMMSAKPLDAVSGEGVDPDALQNHFQKQGRYTAGTATQYPPALLTGGPQWQHLAAGFPIGRRFHSAPVARIADAEPLQLGHLHRADGRWRLYAFGDRPPITDPSSRLRRFAERWIEGPATRFTSPGADIDAVIDVRGILQHSHREVEPTSLPELLRPHKGRYGLADYDKAFAPSVREGDIFAARGIDRDQGCLVLVRPDQYVAHVLPLDGLDELEEFLGRFLLPRRREAGLRA
ncbi:FAD-dependent monooxygenase [Microbacterium sp. zg.B48]|uniref:FAD-dependent monooxygenase n=1 Tax=Microbacterium sp. zg.B48 TaxID=2969408 RepID=UPI00214BC0D9|nr:FAD-dependent monooxygenase [Microbacterium sp. zg.B48]MCR2764306.1 FAD-dependent monooxygenase [Microbacterium sp. zg.B48]